MQHDCSELFCFAQGDICAIQLSTGVRRGKGYSDISQMAAMSNNRGWWSCLAAPPGRARTAGFGSQRQRQFLHLKPNRRAVV